MKNIIKNTNKKGFTIVELVIVIAVIAILAGVLIPTFSSIITKANESAAMQEAQAVYKEIYAVDLSDGELDAKFGTVALTNEGNVPVTGIAEILTNAKITCKGTVKTYAPNITTNTAEVAVKFKYLASNTKTVQLTIDKNGVETWSIVTA